MWTAKGKLCDPFAFSCLFFNPAFSGRFTLAFSSHCCVFDACFIPVFLTPKTGSIPRFLFRLLFFSSTPLALPNSPHTGLFYLSSISSSLWDEKSNVGANWATRGEATFLDVNENKRPQPPASYLTLLSVQKFHHQLRPQYKSLSKAFFLFHPFHSDTCRFM